MSAQGAGTRSAAGEAALVAVRTCGWCVAVLWGVLLVAAAGAGALAGGDGALQIGYVALWATVPFTALTMVVGWPAGWLVAYLMRGVPSLHRNAAVLAGVGAILAATIALVAGLGAGGPVVVVLFALLGAVVAGCGRWIEGRRRGQLARARPRTSEPGNQRTGAPSSR